MITQPLKDASFKAFMLSGGRTLPAVEAKWEVLRAWVKVDVVERLQARFIHKL